MKVSKLAIIGSIDEKQPNGDTHVNHIWFDPETNTPYDHIDGHWVVINPITPDIQMMIDHEVNTMPVLEISSPEYHEGVMYLDTLKGIEENIAMFLGDDEVWRDNGGGSVTIKVTRMSKAEFAALEPLEF